VISSRFWTTMTFGRPIGSNGRSRLCGSILRRSSFTGRSSTFSPGSRSAQTQPGRRPVETSSMHSCPADGFNRPVRL
jgi:hypothetical protein